MLQVHVKALLGAREKGLGKPGRGSSGLPTPTQRNLSQARFMCSNILTCGKAECIINGIRLKVYSILQVIWMSIYAKTY